MSEGYVVYVEIQDEGGMFAGPFRNVFLSISAESVEEAVERATDELPLRAYKRITSVRAVALRDMEELNRW